MARVNLVTILLLVCSNFVMLLAWYGHLGKMAHAPVWKVVLVAWLIAFFEYCLMVPANRIGSRTLSLEQLKIVQEAIALLTFVPFSVLVMKQPVGWNYAAAAVCVLGAVYFIFRG
jgi:uncharacterized protein (DUF486 family)